MASICLEQPGRGGFEFVSNGATGCGCLNKIRLLLWLRNGDGCSSSACVLWEDPYVRIDVISAGRAWGRIGCLKSILILKGRKRASSGPFADSPLNRRDLPVATCRKVSALRLRHSCGIRRNSENRWVTTCESAATTNAQVTEYQNAINVPDILCRLQIERICHRFVNRNLRVVAAKKVPVTAFCVAFALIQL